MSVFGSGAILGYTSRLLFGPTHCIQHVHFQHQADGSKHISYFIRRDTMKSALNSYNQKPWTIDQCIAESKRDVPEKDKRISRQVLEPIENLKTDGVNVEGHRMVPINCDGHIIFKNGKVYDPIAKKYYEGRDTRIQGDMRLKPTIPGQLKMIASTPSVMVRVGGVLALSAIIDTGVYEVGKYNGYRAVSKGKLPSKLLRASAKHHTPGDTHMILSQISPVPLTLKPLSQPDTNFVKPSPQQLSRLQSQIASMQSNSQQPALVA